MPANYLIAGMARSYKMALPLGELKKKRKDQSVCGSLIRRIALHSHLTRPSKNDDQVIG